MSGVSSRPSLTALLSAVFVLTVAVLILASFLLYQGFVERSSLLVTLGTQEQPLRETQQVKAQLDSLASATAKLADQGDPHAKQIIDTMKSQGITVRQ